MLNLLSGLGVAIVVALMLVLLKINFWITLPLGLMAGVGLFIYLGRKVQGKLEQVFNRAAEAMKKQQFDQAIEVMKDGYRFNRWQFLVKGSIDGQIGVVQYLRKKNDLAEPLLRSASLHSLAPPTTLGDHLGGHRPRHGAGG